MQPDISESMRDKFLSLLSFTVENGDQSKIQLLLKQKLELNCELGDEILRTAMRNRQIEILTLLIEAGANIKNYFGQSEPNDFLHQLVANSDQRHQELAMLLMARGADVNTFDNDKANPLYPLDYAIQAGSSIEIIKQLLKHGARVDSFHLVKVAKHPKVVELMPLLAGAITDVRTKSRCVASAIFSCANESADSKILLAVKLLLELNLHKEEMTMNRLTLIRAICSNNVEIVRLFIRYGFDVNNLGLASNSALFVASTLPEPTISKLLIQAGAKINVLSNGPYPYKAYPIHVACGRLSVGHMQLFLRHGADINVTDSFGNTPLSWSDTISDNSKHQMFIKYMVIFMRQGKTINDSDLKMIENNSEMYTYYTQCFSELDKMEKMNIIKNIPFISIFKNSGQLIYFTRNSNVLEAYSKVQRKVEFPIYNEEMDFAFENIKTRKNLLEEEENAICESLNNILPYVPLEKVIYYFYLDAVV